MDLDENQTENNELAVEKPFRAAPGIVAKFANRHQATGGSEVRSWLQIMRTTSFAITLLVCAGCRAPTASSAAGKESPPHADRKRAEPWRENAALVAVRGVIWNETITAAEPIRISLLVRNISPGDVYALKQFNSRNYSLLRKGSSSWVHGDAEGAYADEHFVRLKPGATMVFSTEFWHEEEPGEGEFRVGFHNNMPGEFQAAPQRDGIPVVNDLAYDFGKITVAARNASTNRQRSVEHGMMEPWRANMALVAIRGVIWNEKITCGAAIDVSLVVRNTSKGEVYALKQFNCHNCFLTQNNIDSRVHGDGEGPVFDRDFVRLKPREEMIVSGLFCPEPSAGEASFSVNLHNNEMFEQQIAPQHDGIPIVNHLEYDFGKITIHPSSKSRDRPSRSEKTEKERKSCRLSPGDVIHLRFGCQKGEQPPQMSIDDRGLVRLPLGFEAKVGGLTAAEAASRIRAAYVPRYYRELDVEVEKVRFDGVANGSQPNRAVTNQASSPAGSGR